MTDKEEKTEVSAQEAEAQKPSKSGVLKYIVIGGGAFLVVIAVAVAAMLFLGNNDNQTVAVETTPVESSTEPDPIAERATHESASEADEPPPFYADEELPEQPDPTVIDNIMDNLAFLDYQPEEHEVAGDEDAVMPIEDSVKKVNWLEAEKSALAAKEADLVAREKALALLDKKVSKKLLTLEQAETSRVSDLAKLYDGMDPRSVAQLMANLDDATVVAIIPRMKTKNASGVLALLPPKRAAKLSKQMITIAEN